MSRKCVLFGASVTSKEQKYSRISDVTCVTDVTERIFYGQSTPDVIGQCSPIKFSSNFASTTSVHIIPGRISAREQRATRSDCPITSGNETTTAGFPGTTRWRRSGRGNGEAVQRGSTTAVWRCGVQRRERVSAREGDECGRRADFEQGG
jgi:hypothetical protein